MRSRCQSDQLGSWNTARPSSLSLEQMTGTLPSPWTVHLPHGKPRPYSSTVGRVRRDTEDNYSYPWLFWDTATKQNRPLLHSQALYRRDNVNVV